MQLLANAVLSIAALVCSAPLSVCNSTANSRDEPCLKAFYACSTVGGANMSSGLAADTTFSCNISEFHSLLSATAQSLMVDRISMRLHADALKSRWQGKSGFCYIEAIVSAKGRILFLRFDDSRSLLTGSSGTASWNKLLGLINAYENKPNGMQLLMDLNGQQHCSDANVLSATASGHRNYIFARLMNRSEVNKLPTTNSYINMDFTSSSNEIKRVQQRVVTNSLSWKSVDVANIMLNRQLHPLTVWVYRCPVRLGINDMPCNSKTHAYLFLRSWINNSRAHTQEEDFKNYAGWRYKFLKEDVYLISLMVAIPLYIAIHLHCIMWFGLSPVTTGL